MAFPPTIPPATRTNATSQLDNHPSDHNAISAALTELTKHAVLDSGSWMGALVNVTSGPIDAGTVTIAPVTVASRLLISSVFYLSSNAQWGASYYLANMSGTALLTGPLAFLPAGMGNTYFLGFPLFHVMDIAANTAPSFKTFAQSSAGGGTNSARVLGSWLLVAR